MPLEQDIKELTDICRAALSALPRYSTDPNLQPRIRDLPVEITKLVDVYEQVRSTCQLPDSSSILELPTQMGQLYAELQTLRAKNKQT